MITANEIKRNLSSHGVLKIVCNESAGQTYRKKSHKHENEMDSMSCSRLRVN